MIPVYSLTNKTGEMKIQASVQKQNANHTNSRQEIFKAASRLR